MNELCKEKAIKREFSVARTPQQNGVAKRRNKTLIEAVKTMLADSKLPTTFWAEAVNTACYVQNRVLVVKPYFKTPYELFKGRSPALSFMRPFGCHVLILNMLDQLGKFDGKSDEGIFVGYSKTSKAFKVYNIRTRKVKKNLHITLLETKPMIAGGGPEWLFDIDALSKSMNYAPVPAGTNSNDFAGKGASFDAGQSSMETGSSQDFILMPIWKENSLFDSYSQALDGHNKDKHGPYQASESDNQERPNTESSTKTVNTARPVNIATPTYADIPNDPLMPDLEDAGIFDDAYDDKDKGAEADYNNLETVISVSPIPSTRIHKDHPKEHIIGEPTLGFMDLKFPDRVYKVEKALYGLYQAPRAWYETLSTYLLDNEFRRGITDKTLFIKKIKNDILLVQVYVVDIIFGSTKRPDIMFAVYACSRFQVQPKVSYMHVVKRIFRYLKGQPTLILWYPKDLPLELIAYSDSNYAGASLDRKSTTGEYIADSNYYGQTKHIKISHHFIRDSYEKRLIEMPKIHTDYNVADLLTKAFDVTRIKLKGYLINDGYADLVQHADKKELAIPGKTATEKKVDAVRHTLNDAVLDNPLKTDGFEQIVDFLNANQIKYALTLQALIDGKKVVIIEASIRHDLKLNDAEGTSCLPNAMIFEELARIGYEKPYEKLTFYKAFFSPQWKFFIHTILQCLSAKTTSWNEFSSTMASAIICLANNQKSNFSKYILDNLKKNLEADVPFYMFLRRKEKKERKETKVFLTELPTEDQVPTTFNDPLPSGEDSMPLKKLMVLCTNLSNKVLDLENEVINIKSSYKAKIAELENRVEKLEEENMKIIDIDADAEVNLENVYNLDLDHEETVLSIHDATNADEDQVPTTFNDPLPSGEDSMPLKKLMVLCTNLSNKVLDLENEVINIKSSYKAKIAELENRVEKLEEENMKIIDIDADAEVNLENVYNLDLDHEETVLSIHDATNADGKKLLNKWLSEATKTTVDITTAPKAKGIVFHDVEESTTRTASSRAQVKDKGKAKLVEEPKVLKSRKAQIAINKEVTRRIEAEWNADMQDNIDWNEVVEQVQSRQSDAVRKYQALKRKPVSIAQARKNMMIYLKNMVGFKMKFFKGMSYEEIRSLFEEEYNKVQTLFKEGLEMDAERIKAPRKRTRKKNVEKDQTAKKQKGDELKKENAEKQKLEKQQEVICTDIKRIIRKEPKPNKNEHENGKSTQKP
nr:retrovirus-related Pol polyprotein from transposon TNT 1-94 [Tanacetum cinerariifolium]